MLCPEVEPNSRSPFTTEPRLLPERSPSLGLLQQTFILRCCLKTWSSTLRRLSSPRPDCCRCQNQAFVISTAENRARPPRLFAGGEETAFCAYAAEQHKR